LREPARRGKKNLLFFAEFLNLRAIGETIIKEKRGASFYEW